MTQDYFDNKGGKKCIETFLEHWPEDIRLVVYWEKWKNPVKHWGPRVDDLNMAWVEHLSEFLKAISYFPLMSGNVGNGYNIEYDARMCRAGLIHAHAMKTIGGKVFWIDADTVTHSKVTHEFLDELLPDDKLACCLRRPHFNTETGFLGMNADHPDAKQWVEMWQMVYTSGAIFTQKGWHDNWGFDLAYKWLNKPDVFNDLARALPEGCMHVLINSRVGSVMDHLKGNRKNGKSRKDDLIWARPEPYWNE
jgi:hypothetical protein